MLIKYNLQTQELIIGNNLDSSKKLVSLNKSAKWDKIHSYLYLKCLNVVPLHEPYKRKPY